MPLRGLPWQRQATGLDPRLPLRRERMPDVQRQGQHVGIAERQKVRLPRRAVSDALKTVPNQPKLNGFPFIHQWLQATENKTGANLESGEIHFCRQAAPSH